MVACGGDSHFRKLCQILDRQDLLDNHEYLTNAGRHKSRDILEAELAKSINQWKAADLLSLMEKHDIPGGPINDIGQALSDEHVLSRGLIHEVARDSGTKVKLIGFPVKFSETPARCDITPPRFAQDTRNVLYKELGMNESQIDIYTTQNIIK